MRGGRMVAVLALAAAVLAGCATGPAEEPTAVPTFSATASGAPGASAPRIGLPEDCATLLSADDLGAIYGRPLGSTTLRTIRGIPEPSVGRTERIACQYRMSGPGGGAPLLDVNVGRYDDADAARRQWQLNTNAERSDGQSQDLSIGTAPAVAITRRAETQLAVVYGVDTLTFVLPAAARLPGPPVDRLVDLAQRMLPKDAPTQPTPPDATPAPAPADGPSSAPPPTSLPPVASG
jgi:hypothetical protein